MGKGIDELQRAYDAALSRVNAARAESSKLSNDGPLVRGRDVPGVLATTAQAVYDELDAAETAFAKAQQELDAAR
ncbi:hypothetical protein ACFU7Z_10605 [Kitasatospora sp. NPDC057518]|uniref:hypothetical protein n=1 Tax=Kitasatospora sp. NPDC057518 TaxID=3346155 RepID=UPI00367FC488